MRIILFSLLFVFVLGNKPKDLPRCEPDDLKHPELLCSYYVGLIHPTQSVVGVAEVNCKIRKFNQMDHKELNKYIFAHPIPAVIALDQIFITDHHHLSTALLGSNHDHDHKYVIINVTQEIKTETYSDLYNQLYDDHQIWLYSNTGEYPINPLHLPNSVDLLANDPYRSLAYLVRCHGGYDKLSIPYQDFYWGNYFRQYNLFPLVNKSRSTFCDTIPYNAQFECDGYSDDLVFSLLSKGMNLAKQDRARVLPGYRNEPYPGMICDCVSA